MNLRRRIFFVIISQNLLGAVALKPLEESIIGWTQFIEKHPNDCYAYISRGDLYRKLEQYEQAIKDLNKALELNPTSLSCLAYAVRGRIYRDLEQYELAFNDYDKAISLDAAYFLTYNDRGLAYTDLGQYDMAIQDFTKAINLDSCRRPDAYFNRGNVYTIRRTRDGRHVDDGGFEVDISRLHPR